jgi:tetratricopeptide (TPR) repeat protein
MKRVMEHELESIRNSIRKEFKEFETLKLNLNDIVDNYQREFSLEIKIIHPLTQAHIFYSKGDYEKAIKFFRKVQYEAPSKIKLYDKLFLSLIEIGNYEEAISALEKSLKQYSNSYELKYILGQAYKANGNLLESRRILESIENFKTNPYIMNEIGQISMSQGRFENARLELELSNHLFEAPRFYIFCNLAICQFSSSKTVKGDTNCEKGIQIIKKQLGENQPSHENANLNAFISLMYLLKGDTVKSKTHLNVAINYNLSKRSIKEFSHRISELIKILPEETKFTGKELLNMLIIKS